MLVDPRLGIRRFCFNISYRDKHISLLLNNEECAKECDSSCYRLSYFNFSNVALFNRG